MQRQLTSTELVEFVEKAGSSGLDWSTRYLDLAGSAIGAVFRAHGLDEDSDTLLVGPEIVDRQLQLLEVDLERRGRSPSTIQTYKTVWKRISSLVGEWIVASGTGSEEQFFSTVEQYKDSRRRRRTNRSSPSSPSNPNSIDQLVSHWSAPNQTAENTQVVELDVSSGPVRVQMPSDITREEVLSVIETLIRRTS